MPFVSHDQMFWAIQNEKLAVSQTYTIYTGGGTWAYQIKDSTGTVLVTSGTLPAATRHAMVDVSDTIFTIDETYTIEVWGVAPVIATASGNFKVIRGTIATAFLNSLQLALGLSMLNTRRTVNTWDRITGIPLTETITIYTDETLSSVLATYRVKRRLNDARQVVGEIMYRVVTTGTGTSTSTGTGTGP